MHELSLVRSIFATLKESLEPDEMEKVSQVSLKVGKLANVEPILLQNAYKAFLESNPEYERIKLDIQLVEIVVHCQTCGHKSQISHYKFICSHCETPTNNIISGEELLIHQIHFDSVHA
ncbi:MAG: hydrogenase maturation nickel metallochaperone HypA [Bacteroidota bacterium]